MVLEISESVANILSVGQITSVQKHTWENGLCGLSSLFSLLASPRTRRQKFYIKIILILSRNKKDSYFSLFSSSPLIKYKSIRGNAIKKALFPKKKL